MTDDEKFFVKRLEEIDRRAFQNYYPTYTDFLNANEYSLFLEHQREFQCETVVYSGIELLERQMIAFIPDALIFDGKFPITGLLLTAKSKKFAGEMSHRDVLGTLMGLSIERKLIGDIMAVPEGYLILAKDSIAPLIAEELHRVRHTEVCVSMLPDFENRSIERTFIPRFGTVASMRLDCIVAEMANCSRSQALTMIQSGLVFINARQSFHNATPVKAGDVLSIRKVGKFRITEIGDLSRKGKIKLSYENYK